MIQFISRNINLLKRINPNNNKQDIDLIMDPVMYKREYSPFNKKVVLTSFNDSKSDMELRL